MTVSEAIADRDRVVAEVAAAHPNAIERGLEVIEAHARTGEVFSCNQLRSALAEVGVTRAASGALFSTAARRRLIRLVGYEMSSDARTRHRIAQYVGTGAPGAAPREAVTVPVRRDPGGRFAPGADECGTPSLFDLGASA